MLAAAFAAQYFCFAMVAVFAATFYKKQKSIVMKKLTTIAASLALFFSAGAFSPSTNGDDPFPLFFNNSSAKSVKAENVTRKVSLAFQSEFAKAENVNWSQLEDFYFVAFELNEKRFDAAFSEEGEFIAISRKIPIEQLPLAVTTALEKNYPDYKLTPTVTEIVMQGYTNYYLMAEGKTRYLGLKCSVDGGISIDKKIKKKILVGSVS